MTGLQFLCEWAVRSSILIGIGALGLWLLRVKNPAIRLSVWTAILCGSLAMPAIVTFLPAVRITVIGSPVRHIKAVPEIPSAPTQAEEARPSRIGPIQGIKGLPRRFDPSRIAVMSYAFVAVILLLRLCIGLAMSRRLLRGSVATGRQTEGVEIRESDRVGAPATLGIARPKILLPSDWRDWPTAKLDAVLTHELSHITRRDPLLQLISAIHQALLWHSPLSWFLHTRIVRLAEEASDDAAIAVTGNRAVYAELLLGFMGRGVRGPRCAGVPMARYGPAEKRIERILDGSAMPGRTMRWGLAAILVLMSPLAYVVAAARPQTAVQRQPAPVPRNPAVQKNLAAPQPSAQPVRAGTLTPEPFYLRGLGNVSAFYTVTVRTRVDGPLTSVNFEEGALIQAGEVLATIDPRPYEIQLARAEGQLAQDRAQTLPGELLDARVRTDQANIDQARLQLAYTRLTAPITGIAGLRLVDPGNIVHAADTGGIVVITQLQPIAVLCSLPEDTLPEIRSSIGVPVEAWNRDNTVKLATGRLTAVNNLIDVTEGTIKFKAVFDNQDGALFPNQFVNVRVLLKTR